MLPLAATAARAQDTRTVTEPKIPAACATLDAALAAKHGLLSAADEQKLDTVRIQAAIDGCTKSGEAEAAPWFCARMDAKLSSSPGPFNCAPA
jgi:polygalacturonase